VAHRGTRFEVSGGYATRGTRRRCSPHTRVHTWRKYVPHPPNARRPVHRRDHPRRQHPFRRSRESEAQSLVGTLQKVEGQTLTVQTSKGTETVTLAPNAHIVHGSKTVAASDLSSATGSRVKVRYMTSNGEKQAETVTVSAAKPAPAHKKA
jgi:hypothetical protein